jgi:DNA repair protein RecO (recombination protein O)
VNAFRALREDLERTTYAHYVAELLDQFTSEGQENRLAFELLTATLQHLCDASDLRLAARFYELRLLALEGYQPQLFRCLSCGDIIQPVVNYFHPEQGGILCPRCGEGLIAGLKYLVRPVSVNTLKVLRYLQTHDYGQCSRLRLKPDTHRDLEALMLHYITYVLERNLKSVAFLNRVRDKEGI